MKFMSIILAVPDCWTEEIKSGQTPWKYETALSLIRAFKVSDGTFSKGEIV